MNKVYVYITDTLADWEYGYAAAELKSGRFFKKDKEKLDIKTVSLTKDSIKSMGGITIIPDCTLDEIIIGKTTSLLLIGAETWEDKKHIPLIKIIKEIIHSGGMVAGICGAALFLANTGILDDKLHTGNSLEYTKMLAPNYKGEKFYREKRAVIDKNIITASAAGALLWTKYIIEYLDVFTKETLEAWYKYYETGEQKYLYEVLGNLEVKIDNL